MGKERFVVRLPSAQQVVCRGQQLLWLPADVPALVNGSDQRGPVWIADHAIGGCAAEDVGQRRGSLRAQRPRGRVVGGHCGGREVAVSRHQHAAAGCSSRKARLVVVRTSAATSFPHAAQIAKIVWGERGRVQRTPRCRRSASSPPWTTARPHRRACSLDLGIVVKTRTEVDEQARHPAVLATARLGSYRGATKPIDAVGLVPLVWLATVRLSRKGPETMLKRIAIACLGSAALIVTSAGVASAGEVNGNGAPTQGPAHANSICAYSGLNDNPTQPGEGGRVQSYGQVVKQGGKPFAPSPGVACNGHSGFLAGGGTEG